MTSQSQSWLPRAPDHLCWAGQVVPGHRWSKCPCWDPWDVVWASSRSGANTLLTARTEGRKLSDVCVHGGRDVECRRAWVGAMLLGGISQRRRVCMWLISWIEASNAVVLLPRRSAARRRPFRDGGLECFTTTVLPVTVRRGNAASP